MSSPSVLDRWVTRGFWIAGGFNVLGMLLFSELFTNTVMAAVDPAVFSRVGQIAVILWGLAYCSVASTYKHVPWLIAVFAVEKLVYSIVWVVWVGTRGHTLPSIASESLLTSVFYAVYGLGDILSCIFFAWVVTHVSRRL